MPDATDRYLQTWVVEASVDETVEAIIAAAGSDQSAIASPVNSLGSATRLQAVRKDKPEWQLVKQDPAGGTVWLKYRQKRGLPHDVAVRVYALDDKQVLVKAFCRSRMRFFNYRQNRRILSTLMGALEAHWSHHGMPARPSLGEHLALPE